MNQYIEKRKAERVKIECELQFRALGLEPFHDASHIDLSHSGISFCSNHAFQINDKIEVKIIPEPPVMYVTVLIVTVVRIEARDDGFFRVGAVIDYDYTSSHPNSNDGNSL